MAAGREPLAASETFDLGALTQRVYAVERGQTALGERIDAMAQGLDGRIDRLTQALERRSQPQYQAISVLLTFIGMIGAIVYLLIQSQVGDVRVRTTENRENLAKLVELVREDYVPRSETASWRADDQARVDRLADAVTQLRQDSITVSDHQALVERVARVEQVFGDTYSIGDVLKDLQARLTRIEERPFRTWNGNPPSPPSP